MCVAPHIALDTGGPVGNRDIWRPARDSVLSGYDALLVLNGQMNKAQLSVGLGRSLLPSRLLP